LAAKGDALLNGEALRMGPGAGRGTAKAVRGRREEGRGREVAGPGTAEAA